MMITNKPLYTIVVMALSLVRAAPVDSDNNNPEIRIIDAIPAHKGHLEVGHQAGQITAPMDTNNVHAPNHQIKVLVEGSNDQPLLGEFSLNQQHHTKHHHDHDQDYDHDHNHEHGEKHSHHHEHYEDDDISLEDEVCMGASEELAQHVISLREYIDTLDEEEYDSFLDSYLDEGSEDDMLVLELALELEEDEDGNMLEPTFDCEDALQYVSNKEMSHHKQHGHHASRHHHHRNHHQSEEEDFEREVKQDAECSKEEMENGTCEPIEEHRSARLHHKHQQHHSHHFREGKEINPGEARHQRHAIHPIDLTQADGFPHGENATHLHLNQPHHHQDEDLLSHNGAGGLHHAAIVQAQATSSPLAFAFNATPIPVKREESAEEDLAKRANAQEPFDVAMKARSVEVSSQSASV